MVNLPDRFLENMETLLGKEEFLSYLKSFENERLYGLRVNTDKISVEDFLKISPFELKKVPWSHNGFYYDSHEKPAKHPFYFAGLYYLQEPSAMTPAEVLPVSPGDRVLDICAAPGGKSTELAVKLGDEGLLVSNDISVSRAQALLKNIELFGVKNALVLAEDPKKLVKYFPEYFDKILIDAPCSGEGMFRKEPSVIRSWEEHGNAFFVNLQKQITEYALKMLKPGGMLVYSTCTFSPEEDEKIIEHIRTLSPEIEILDIPNRYEAFAPGVSEDPEYRKCARLYPFRIDGEGHFVTLMKKGDAETSLTAVQTDTVKPVRLPKEAEEFLSHTSMSFSHGHFEFRAEKLYFVPDTGVVLDGLHILRNGLFIGEYKTNRFEPSQAFAMALKKEEFDKVLDLELSDDRVLKYLKGETIEGEGEGYILVLVEGFPLGFAKGTGGKLKNKYLKGWRYQ